MKEIEAKIIEIEPEKVRGKLEELGAEKKDEGEVKSVFYDFPDGRIEENGVLRLRSFGKRCFITLKKEVSREGAKEMEETEVDVGSFDMADRLLKGIGLEEIKNSSKKREKYDFEGTEIVIDQYPGIPPLLEVEAEDRERLKQVIEELGYEVGDTVFWNAAEVFHHYEKD